MRGFLEQFQMFSKYDSWHNRWLPTKKKKPGQITKILKWQELDLAHDVHASMPTTRRHLVASSLFTLDVKSLHNSDCNIEIKTLTQTSHKDCKAWTMRWCVSEFDIYPYFEQMQSPDWQAGSGVLLSSELVHTVEQTDNGLTDGMGKEQIYLHRK